MATLGQEKTSALFNRVYFSKMEENDETILKEVLNATFGKGGLPNPALLHDFNELVVKQATVVVKPKLQDLLSIFASFKPAKEGEVVKYEVPKGVKAKFKRHGAGSAVQHVRADVGESILAQAVEYSTGFQYDTAVFQNGDPVGEFKRLVDDIAEAMARNIFEEVTAVISKAVETQDIPANNILSGANITLKDYNKVVSRLMRYGGVPVFVADTLLIDHFAEQQATVANGNLITDSMIEGIVRDLYPTKVGRSNAVSLINPFTDKTNSKTEYKVNEGYLLATDGKVKPVAVTTFGSLKQKSTADFNDERVLLKLAYSADVTLFAGELIGKVTETSAVTL